ncbi:hypothetical protein BASA81_000118 [Batrachochytrium salamandrivorans]|nr:hypothetical protein BASA81_000118 [Batrachochytrium salamandrivorans]
MELPQNDPALDAFDRLRVREVSAEYGDIAPAVLAEFQSIAASLEPDERIKIDVAYMRGDAELLKAVLADPQANKICALQWEYGGKEDVNSIIPLLINNCPELASLSVCFEYHSEFDFVSSVLEHPNNKLKELDLPVYPEENLARLFAALKQSQVSALALCYSPEFAQGFCDYLARGVLVRFEIAMHGKQVPSEMMMSLAKCTRLAKLKISHCEFSQPTTFTHLPKSITELELSHCTFVDGVDWSFLADSNVQELDFYDVKGVDGNRLGGALAVHLRAKGMDMLRLFNCDFVDEILAIVGLEVGRIKKLDIYGHLNDASIELIALALQAPNNEMKKLRLTYNDMASSIETYLVPALRHPNCNLAKLGLPTYGGSAKTIQVFRKRRALFALLQGQQVKRRYCPLRRLPVEMFRLVGKALI